MKKFIPKNLIALSKECSFPLYVIGGSVRDFLAGYARGKEDFSDWDICAPVLPETFASVAEENGFTVQSVYKNTGTVKLTDQEGIAYEFSSFRSDKYVRGEHTPAQIFFTDDIELDAKRRDFTCNAVYYDIQNGKFVDPLGGIEDIKNKTVRTVRESERVFGEDGLRLMRFARQCAQLGFTPASETLQGAIQNCDLIQDISPERILTELNMILQADQKYGVEDGHYRGLDILRRTKVLGKFLPELALGDGMAQRADFHKYDVLEHSFRCVLYSPPQIRMAALLHDVGKPFCKLRDGNVHAHPEEGARIATELLNRLKAPKKLIVQCKRLIEEHMYDMDCRTKERKLRRYLVENYDIVEELLSIKQADFSACTDDLSVAPTVARWKELLIKMKAEGVPFSVKDLKISGKELLNSGMVPSCVGKVLHGLLMHCANEPKDNTPERLKKEAKGIYYTIVNTEEK